MAKAAKQKQSIKDAAKEAYLKSHTKEQMYVDMDMLVCGAEINDKEVKKLRIDLQAKTNEAIYANDMLTRHKKDASHWRVKCNQLTLENVSLTMALNDQKLINKTYQWAIVIITSISTIFLYFK